MLCRQPTSPLQSLRSCTEELTRRRVLGGGVALGLGLPRLLRANAEKRPTEGTAKSCIVLYMTGGPAQQETFDPKPNANDGYRGEFSAISTSVAGVHYCEHLPLLAERANQLAVIRSTFHNSNTHGVGVHYNLTGLPNAPRERGEPQMDRRDPPSVGGAVRQLRGDANGLPAAVHLPVRIGDQNNFQWGGQHAGFLGPAYDPLMLIDEKWQPGTLPPGFAAPADVGRARQRERSKLLSRIDRATGAATEASYARHADQVLALLDDSSAWRALDLAQEKAETLARYGDNKFGRSCLVARRLIEAGVAVVTVPWMHIHSTKNFDTHENHFKLMKGLLLPPMDRAFSALVDDLQERGLLDETLVVWTGEFGRTPKVNKKAGRDHWGPVYSTALVGGGVVGGQVIGATDGIGGYPTEHPVHTQDFVASIYHALGYGPKTRVVDQGGRPHFIVQGQPVRSLF